MIRGTEDDQPFNNSGEVLDLLGVPDIQRMIVEPRLTANDPTTRIESTGWSGLGGAQIKRRIFAIDPHTLIWGSIACRELWMWSDESGNGLGLDVTMKE